MATFDVRELESKLKALQGFHFEDRRKYWHIESPPLLEEDYHMTHYSPPHSDVVAKKISYKNSNVMISHHQRNLPLQVVHEEDTIHVSDDFISIDHDETPGIRDNGIGKMSSNGFLYGRRPDSNEIGLDDANMSSGVMTKGYYPSFDDDKFSRRASMPKSSLMKQCSSGIDTMSNYAKFKMMKEKEKEKEKDGLTKWPYNNKEPFNGLLNTSSGTCTSTITSTCSSGASSIIMSNSPYNSNRSFNAQVCGGSCDSTNIISGDQQGGSNKLASASTKVANKETCHGIFDSFNPVVRSSYDPKKDFEESMVEMILHEKHLMHRPHDMLELLQCYLILNSKECHDLIVRVFTQVWLDLLNEHG